jgi:putative oxidoreductase
MEFILWLLPLLARFLIGGYFVLAGIQHFKHQHVVLDKLQVRGVIAKRTLFIIANSLQIIGGGMVLLGFFMFTGALLLLPINFFAAIIFHPYWLETGEMRWLQRTCFWLRIMVVTGSLLLLIEPVLLNSLFIFLSR